MQALPSALRRLKVTLRWNHTTAEDLRPAFESAFTHLTALMCLDLTVESVHGYHTIVGAGILEGLGGCSCLNTLIVSMDTSEYWQTEAIERHSRAPLPGSICQLPALEQVTLCMAGISELPADISRLSKLTMLDIIHGWNWVRDRVPPVAIPTTLSTMRSLEVRYGRGYVRRQL